MSRQPTHVYHYMAIDLIEEHLRDLSDEPDEAAGVALAVALHELASRLKHPAFSEEKEWRLVSRPVVAALSGVDFREGRSVIVPYRQFALSESPDHQLPLGDITIGPTPHAKLAQRSVVAIFRKHFVNTGQVRLSKAPYRVW